jgi:hypothetical protein
MEMNIQTQQKINKKPSVLGVIFSPTVQFERMKKHVNVLNSFLLLIFLSVVAGMLVMYAYSQTPEAMQEMEGIVDNAASSLQVKLIFTCTIAFVGALFTYMIKAGIYKVFLIFMGNNTTYKTILCITIYANIIIVIGKILNGIIAVLIGGSGQETYTSVAMLFGSGTMLYEFGDIIDIFSVWTLIVMWIGLRITAELSKKQATLFVSILFIFSFISAIFSGFIRNMS